MKSSWKGFEGSSGGFQGFIFILVAIGCGVGGGVLAANGQLACIIVFILAVIFLIVGISFFVGKKVEPSNSQSTVVSNEEPKPSNEEILRQKYVKYGQQLIAKKTAFAYRMTADKFNWEEDAPEKEFRKIVSVLFVDLLRDGTFTKDDYVSLAKIYLSGKTIVSDDDFKDHDFVFDVEHNLIGSLTRAAILIGHYRAADSQRKYRAEAYKKGISINYGLNWDSEDIIERHDMRHLIAFEITNALRNPPSEEDKTIIKEMRELIHSQIPKY